MSLFLRDGGSRLEQEDGGVNEFIPFEKYRVVLYHDYYDSHGKSHRLGEPLCIEYSIMHGERFCPVPIMINEMMDKMKHGLLDLLEKETE